MINPRCVKSRSVGSGIFVINEIICQRDTFKSDRVAANALTKVINKLETLTYQYTCMYLIYLHFICWN